MRIETKTPGAPVEVNAGEQQVELIIGEPSETARRVAVLSVPQARMLLHAIGLAVAQVEERERLLAEERAQLAGQLADE